MNLYTEELWQAHAKMSSQKSPCLGATFNSKARIRPSGADVTRSDSSIFTPLIRQTLICHIIAMTCGNISIAFSRECALTVFRVVILSKLSLDYSTFWKSKIVQGIFLGELSCLAKMKRTFYNLLKCDARRRLSITCNSLAYPWIVGTY